MQMFPPDFLRFLQSPGMVEQQVKAYLTAAKYEISNDKTFGGTAYYQWQSVAGVSTLEYFSNNTTFVQAQTNVPGNNFIRPQSEHQLIFGMRVRSAVTVAPAENDWQEGCVDAWGKNCVFSITSNGVIMVKDYPLAEALENLTTTDNGLIMFRVPFIWGGQEELKITLRNKDGVNGTANTNYHLELIGAGLYS